MRAPLLLAAALVVGGCGSDDRPVNVPEVPVGAYEADCQRLCTPAAGESICGAKHVEFCVASCRARTNGLSPTCAACVVAAGTALHGFTSGDDSYCDTGGPAGLMACARECDDAGAAGPEPALATQCELACGFYMQGDSPLACSADGSADCRTACAATIAARGRVCAQCLIDDTVPARICINSACDCEPFFQDDPSLSCTTLCDSAPP